MPVGDMPSDHSNILVAQESVRVITERLLGICQSGSHHGYASKKIITRRMDDDKSSRDVSWRRSLGVSLEQGWVEKLSPMRQQLGVFPHQVLQASIPLILKKTDTGPLSDGSALSKPSRPSGSSFGPTLTDKNYANIKKFISSKI